MKKLYRSKDAMIGGVCAGIAEYLGIDKTVVRVGYAILTLITGGVLGILAYIICMFVMPLDDDIIDG
ncbi:MAG: PspC domain-containing protein [Firmicutes bacterium]|nr:PspC domain-containing protein [Bacillota bacterium]